MDANVLAAQQWVNATYRAVTGYSPVTEDGVAGWQTMYALTRALQHELGLTTLADNFGTGTLSALSAHGSIGPGETNHNIVKIAESGLYCKGYDPQGITGVYGPTVTAAVNALMTDAGLAAKIDGKLAPKVFKAVLNMDGYRLAGGGSAAIRAAQQWLNGRYLSRSAFYVLPCDGYNSRDVLRSLTFGVQYEMGLTDSVANGTFGPTTQAGLKAQGLVKAGSTGPWVQLFTAALALYPAGKQFTATFGDQVVSDARALQAFCCLPVTGEGDFTTWASLLISTGDQARAAAAADTITEVTTGRAGTLIDGGYGLIGRYLTNVEGSGFDKKIKPGEIARIFDNGLRIFPIYQTYGDSASYFTRAQGYADATDAHDAALGHGFDSGTVIYFAVDYDAVDTEIDGRVVPYFLGVEAGLRDRGRRYAHGLYGARNVCIRVSREAYAQWSFVSGITSGWSGNMGYPLPDNWVLDQFATKDIGTGGGLIEVDRCALRPGTDSGEAAVNSTAPTRDEFLTWLQGVHDAAVAFGGANPDALVLGYLRAGRYDNWQAEQLYGPIDKAFAASVEGPRMRVYRDPVADVDVDVSQFGAACLAAWRTTGVRADFGGWGADLVALAGSGVSYESSSSRIGSSTVVSAFGAAQAVASVDAYHAAADLRSGSTLLDHLRDADPQTRYSRFMARRFGLSTAFSGALVTSVTSAARALLIGADDAQVAAARGRMLGSAVADDAALGDFCRGFADALVALAQAEQ